MMPHRLLLMTMPGAHRRFTLVRVVAWLAVATLALTTSQLTAADWPRWRGPHADGVVHDQDAPLTAAPNQWPELWRADVGTGFSSLAVADGRVYTLGHRDEQETIWCLDATNGAVLWQHSYPEPLDPNLFEGGPTATPTVAAGKVLAISRQGQVHCLDAATGELLWRVELTKACEVNVPQWGFAGSPVVHGELVLLNAGSRGVALRLADGGVAWQSDNSDDAGYATPLLMRQGERTFALMLSGKALHAIDPATGNELWNYRWLTRYGINAADPIVTGDRVFLSSGYGKGSVLLQVQESGVEERWRSRELRNQMSPGVLVDGVVYAVDGDAGSDTLLKAIAIDSGATLWSRPGLGSATLIAVGNTLCVLSGEGELLLAPANPASWQPLAQKPLLTGKCWTPPAFADGVLYARNAAGTLVAVRLR
ncbi:MAG: PQQ-binding-like beta-propeller repeat protein [Planctomycetaceae bacterium]